MHTGGTAGICWITLDRPERLNAFDWRMLVELRAALWQATFDDDIRVVVITGAGRGFSAGRDINDLRWQRGLPGNSYRSYVRTNHSTFDDTETIEKPVIAATGRAPVVGWNWRLRATSGSPHRKRSGSRRSTSASSRRPVRAHG